MSRFGKFKAIFGAVEPLAKITLPGGVGTALDLVKEQLDTHGPHEAVRALAQDSDEQTAAILALHQRNEELEKRLKALEGK